MAFYIDTFLVLALILRGFTGRFFHLAFIFYLVSGYSFFLTYMSHETSSQPLLFFLLLTEAGCLGVFLTGDLFSLFFFFELMSLASYPPGMQKRKRLWTQGKVTFLGVAGDCLLLGIILLNGFLGTAALQPCCIKCMAWERTVI